MDITQIIDRYIEEMRALIYEKYTAKDSVSTWLGMGKVQNNPFHKQLYKDVEQEVTALTSQLEASPDADLAERAVRAVLACDRGSYSGVEDSIRLGLISIEALAIPLLGHMTPEAVGVLHGEYADRYPERDMLPKQRELYRCMCECSGEKKAGRAVGLRNRRSRRTK